MVAFMVLKTANEHGRSPTVVLELTVDLLATITDGNGNLKPSQVLSALRAGRPIYTSFCIYRRSDVSSSHYACVHKDGCSAMGGPCPSCKRS